MSTLPSSFVVMTTDAKYLVIGDAGGFSTGKALRSVGNINHASVFQARPTHSRLSDRDLKWFDSCVKIPAYEVRTVQIGEKPKD